MGTYQIYQDQLRDKYIRGIPSRPAYETELVLVDSGQDAIPNRTDDDFLKTYGNYLKLNPNKTWKLTVTKDTLDDYHPAITAGDPAILWKTSFFMIIRGVTFIAFRSSTNPAEDADTVTISINKINTFNQPYDATIVLMDSLVGHGGTARVLFYNSDDATSDDSTAYEVGLDIQKLTGKYAGDLVQKIITQMQNAGVLSAPKGICECPEAAVTTGDYTTSAVSVSFATAFFIMCAVILCIGIIAIAIAKSNIRL